ncbi:unnamed protein product [Rotaria sp. Silwood1]|nr:unnamed protein product [Rotaria sp. Silwood1]CAF1595449.1 unnamed protein product [Rotaria sp. Silwood1]CAF3732851.1 unnamed protein product [Rotaria sp. Silwood1]CAF4836084.1 unnamed protein product [Rotaria sp. Silwood1]CAF4917759.1 unnamed protein product [Rotaria sp. Silwood1]
MTTVNESKQCSICNKPIAKSFCIGCKKYFCRKDFKEHEQQLSIKFDNEIVRSHDELLDRIYKLEKSNNLSLDLFDQIEQWKKTTINKTNQAAEKNFRVNLHVNTKWIQNSITVAGNNERGYGLNQLGKPWGLCIADDQTIYIADSSNHRIME